MRGWRARARPRGDFATRPMRGRREERAVRGWRARARPEERGVVGVWGIPSVASLISGYIMRIYGVFGVRRMDLFFI